MLPGVDRHHPQRRHRPDAHGDHRHGGRYVITGAAARRPLRAAGRAAGFATEIRNNLEFNAGQRAVINFKLKLSTVQETVTVAGDSPMVQTTSAEVSTTIDRTAFETLPVKERNYLRLLTLDSNVVASRHRHQRGQRRRRRGVELRHLRRRHQQPLEVADAAARAAARLGRVRARDGQGNAAHHQPVLGRVRRPRRRRVQHDHQERHQRGERLGVRDDPARRLGRHAAAGAATKAPYNQQQFGGTVGGPMVKDRAFFFGSYERRRERSQVVVTSPEASGAGRADAGRRAPGPVPSGDLRFTDKNSLGVRYNMVRWNKDNESGGLNLPGTGFIWDNNVDTVHGTFMTVGSRAVPERSARPVLALYRLAARPSATACRFVRTAYATSGGYDFRARGACCRRRPTTSPTRCRSGWAATPSRPARRSPTTSPSSCISRCRTASTASPARRPWRRTRSSFSSRSRWCPKRALMFPKAYVLASFVQDDWRVRNNLTLNLGLRYDVEIIKDIPDWPAPTDKNNLDPRVGFAWDPKGDQKWAIRGGFGRFTQQHAIFTIVKGGVGGRNGLVTVSLDADRSAVPDLPERAAGVPAGSGAAAARHPGDLADLENEHAWTGSLGVQRQLGPRTSVAVDANINRGSQARLPRHEPGGADSEGRAERRARRRIRTRRSHAGAGRRDAADRAGARTASAAWTC